MKLERTLRVALAAPLAVVAASGTARADGEGLALSGGAGLLHTEHVPRVEAGRPLRLALNLDGVAAGSLCTTSQPCVDASTGGRATSDDGKQLRASLGGSLQLAKVAGGALEGVVASRVSTTSDSVATVDTNLTVIGATNVGLRYGLPVASWMHVGAHAALLLPGARGFAGFDIGSTGARIGALLTADLRPVRLSVNAAYVLDNSGNAVTSTEEARGAAVGRIERFGLDFSRVDHADFAVGGEALLAGGRVRPFVEYAIAVPTNRQGYRCNPLDGTDRCLANEAVAPSSATLGLRAFPWASGLAFLAAADVGVTGTTSFIAEVAPNAPYRLYLGASYDLDLARRAPSATLTVNGVVRDTDGEPLAGARVRGASGETITDDAGAFTLQTSSDARALSLAMDGFREAACTAEGEGPTLTARCTLVLAPTSGTIAIALRDATTAAPAPGVEVWLRDGAGKEALRTSDRDGVARFAGRAAGLVHIEVSDDAHFERAGDATIVAGEASRLEWPLVTVPTADRASVVGDATAIRLRPRVAFGSDGAVDPASIAGLQELAHALRRRPAATRFTIVAYADGTFAPEDGAQAASARASAIVTWLAAHGVRADRLTATGAAGEGVIPPGATARTVRVEAILANTAPTPAMSPPTP